MNRKKRLEKGIKSIEEEIKKHEEKRLHAKEKGRSELADYYDKEIKGLKKQKKEKKNKLRKANLVSNLKYCAN
ncbi:MAG: hypothetical protein AABW50_03820 [Nanoarchaeota archaeon]